MHKGSERAPRSGEDSPQEAVRYAGESDPMTPKLSAAEEESHQKPASTTATLVIAAIILLALGLLVLWYTR